MRGELDYISVNSSKLAGLHGLFAHTSACRATSFPRLGRRNRSHCYDIEPLSVPSSTHEKPKFEVIVIASRFKVAIDSEYGIGPERGW